MTNEITSVVNTPSDQIATKTFIATNYVPYTGATTSVDLGSYNLTGNYIYGSTIGIGTLTPSYKLDVKGAGTDSEIISRFYGNSSTIGSLTIKSKTAAAPGMSIGTAGSGEKLGFHTVNSEKMTLDALGNLGIGTTSPSSVANRFIHIYDSGSAGYSFQNSVRQWSFFVQGTTGNYGLYNHSTSSYALMIGGTNLVGVNIQTATSRLHVYDATAQSLRDGNTSLRLEYQNSSGAALATGAMLTFAQPYQTGNATNIRTGAVRGLKTEVSGNYGGGIQLMYNPSGDVDLLAGLTINHLGYSGFKTNTPLATGHFAGAAALSTATTSEVLVLERPYNSGVAFGILGAIKLGNASGISNSAGRLDFGVNAATSSIPANPTSTSLSNIAYPLSVFGTGEIQMSRSVGNSFSNLSSNYNLHLYDTRSQEANVGGGLLFYGNYTGTTPTAAAGIKAMKVNGTAGEYDFDLVMGARKNGVGGITESFRIYGDQSGARFGTNAINVTRLSTYGAIYSMIIADSDTSSGGWGVGADSLNTYEGGLYWFGGDTQIATYSYDLDEFRYFGGNVYGNGSYITSNSTYFTFNGITIFQDEIQITQPVVTESVTSDTTIQITVNGVSYKLLAKVV